MSLQNEVECLAHGSHLNPEDRRGGRFDSCSQSGQAKVHEVSVPTRPDVDTAGKIDRMHEAANLPQLVPRLKMSGVIPSLPYTRSSIVNDQR